MSFYTQDNDHSAVTGGIGTEYLQVYTVDLMMNWKKDSVRAIDFDLGADIISSASTDNIDFVVSSASKEDIRTHLGLGYTRFLTSRTIVGINTTGSIESDYTSWNLGLTIGHVSRDQSQEWSVNVQTFFDDLRWGRFENGRPQKLIYPQELRNKKWFDDYRRNSFNVEFSFFQTINKRTALGIMPAVIYQKGLLSTPFHRVYFTDDSERVENLPGERWKIPVAIQLNRFIGSQFILKATYRYYWDDFGISAHTLTMEVPIKFSAVWTLLPSLRFYTQTNADFFKPYKKHDAAQEFYTSDYDLSNFNSYKIGMGFRYAPYAVKRKTIFNEIETRYSLYLRSDGLVAHMLSVYIQYSKEKNH